MKLEKTEQELELGFQIPPPGTYGWEIQDGISLKKNEESGKTTLMIPMKVISVVDGSEEALERKAAHFVPIETEFGERQLVRIINIVGLLEAFTSRFGDSINPTDENFINGLKLKLPGKILKGVHNIRKNLKNQDQVNFLKFLPLASVKGSGKTDTKDSIKKQQAAPNAEW